MATTWLNKPAVESYTSVLDYEATVLVHDLYYHSNGGKLAINPQPHAGRCSLNNMLTITFGMRTDTIEHPLVAEALRLSRAFMSVSYLFIGCFILADALLKIGIAPVPSPT